MAESRRSPSQQPCCLPNEILTNNAGLTWTIEAQHHISCANRDVRPHEDSVRVVTS